MRRIERIQNGVYKVTDSEGVWIARGGYATMNGKWVAFDCEKFEDCSDLNSWGVQFNTFKELKDYAFNFDKN